MSLSVRIPLVAELLDATTLRLEVFIGSARTSADFTPAAFTYRR